ncbi:hypothetical protein D3C83_194180 [compost metagenome]
MPHARLAEIGTLYTAIAGMLNLLVIIDAAGRADDLRAASTGKRRGASHAFQAFSRVSTADPAHGR